MKNSACVVIVAALSVIALGCGRDNKAETETYNEKIINVEFFTVQPTRFEDAITLPVVVVPDREVNLGLTNGGRVTRVLVDKGDRVTKGQLLLETDDTVVRASCDMSAATYEWQKNEYARAEKLFADKSISEADFEAARNALAQVKAAYEIAVKNVEEATLEAPFNGIVTMKNCEVGDMLAPGAPAFRIIDMNTVRIQAGIPEKYIADFRKGNRVSITIDAIPGKSFNATIGYVAPEADSSVRTFLAEMNVDNRDGTIRAGVMGNARIVRKIYNDAVMVPLNAVIQTQNGRVAFVLLQDNTVEERTVEVGPVSELIIKIEKGISPGDRVIVKGQHQIANGEKVRVVGESGNLGAEGTDR